MLTKMPDMICKACGARVPCEVDIEALTNEATSSPAGHALIRKTCQHCDALCEVPFMSLRADPKDKCDG